MDFVLSKNDKTDPPHNTQKIIAESLGNKQDLLEIGRQREAMGGGDKKSAAAKSGLSKNDKPDPPHNTQKIIAESLGNKQDLLEIGKQKEIQKGKEGREIQLGGLSKNDKPLEPPHNTREIIAESLGMSTGKAKHPLEMLRFQNVTVT